MVSNKIKIVILAVIFNLLFEYSIRGFYGLFLYKGLIIFLIILYFSYFMIVDSLIRKFRINNLQILIVSFCFGTLIVTFFAGNIFINPTYVGVNIPKFFFVNIVWWGFLQALLTFYLATRIVQRDWNEKPMGRLGFFIYSGYIIVFLIFTFIIVETPKGTLLGYIFSLAFFISGLLYLKIKLKKPQQEIYRFKKSLLLDILSFGSVIFFLFSGTFIATSQTYIDGMIINIIALNLSIVWTVLVFIGMILYYLKNKEQITT